MKHLVLTVTPDSSIQLLKEYADVVILDDVPQFKAQYYDTIYIRSHFATPGLAPQDFQVQIESIVKQLLAINPHIRAIDQMSTVEQIVTFEDKFNQYELFSGFFPKTLLYQNPSDIAQFARPIYKKRVSSRGAGVTWDQNVASSESNEWLIQESLDIDEELRVYVIRGLVHPVAAVHKSLTATQRVEVSNSRALTEKEIEYASQLMQQAPQIDIAGIDIARTKDGSYWVMEVNRSPGFAKFFQSTGSNLAEKLYTSLS